MQPTMICKDCKLVSTTVYEYDDGEPYCSVRGCGGSVEKIDASNLPAAAIPQIIMSLIERIDALERASNCGPDI